MLGTSLLDRESDVTLLYNISNWKYVMCSDVTHVITL